MDDDRSPHENQWLYSDLQGQPLWAKILIAGFFLAGLGGVLFKLVVSFLAT